MQFKGSGGKILLRLLFLSSAMCLSFFCREIGLAHASAPSSVSPRSAISANSANSVNSLPVPCSSARSSNLGNQGGLLKVSTSKFPQCARMIPYISSLVQSSILTRVEAYYHLCDVPSTPSGTTTAASSMASPPSAPKSCAELANSYQNICSASGSIFPGTPCDPFGSQDFQALGIASGCSAESTVNHLGNSCGSYMSISASMKSSTSGAPNPSKACMVSGAVASGGTQAETSLVLGIMIHSLAYYLTQVLSEISTGSMNLTSPMAIAMALGSGGVNGSVGSISAQMIQLQNQANLGDLLICSGVSAASGATQSAGVFISGCQTNSVYQSLLANYSQIAVLEIYYRADQAYRSFIQTAKSYSQMAIENIQFTRGTCNSTDAQSKYEKQFPLVIQEKANAIWR